jgi:hypothetical protein
LDLFDVARSCARRWYVFLPLLLIVGWFSYDSYSSVKPVYYSNAVIGLTPPSTKVYNPPSGVPTPRNGLLDIGGADLIANMAAGGLREPSAVDAVVAAGGLPDYRSKMFPVPAGSSPLPMIMIEETAADPAAVTRTLELVIAQADVTLRALQQQAQVPETEMMTPFVVNSPSTPSAGMPSRTRSTVAIFVAGAGLVVLLTVIVDTLLIRLIRRKAKRVRGLLVEDVAEAEAVATEVETEDAVPANANEPNDVTTAPEGALEAR